ncbi:LysR family transcriptional regulator [Sphingobium algorifonticola]|uniref:LysR family transcriptional regulator n=1 Tax=Sphingobium algorifonticola TaxID=2008318 RepID=A0A437J6R6_9SPHN|nr:LysR substrate-binding domain-containing protein [Sphingobium algorifonticola]RVT40840.1 LysR family transcriptional regulator [Sphingobium algorifonticola]
MIDRYLLRYFLAVVDHGTFSRAAAHCNVSQPTLSVGIAKLERLLAAPLFVRSNQRVRLTDAGTRFLVHARRIESEFMAAAQAVVGSDRMPLLRIGWLGSVASHLLAPAVRTTAQAGHPIEMVEGSERELLGFLARGRIDVALSLVERGGDRFLEEPLMREGYALALPATHRLAAQDVIAAEDIGGEVMIVRRHCEVLSETSRHFTERGIRPHFAFRSTQDDRVLAMIGAGLGLTVMPQSHVAPDVVRPALAGFAVRRAVGLLYGAQAERWRDDPHPFLDAVRANLSIFGN